MSELHRKSYDNAREEDYRDYEALDAADGWPYADDDGRKRNIRYSANRANPGAEIASDTVLRRGAGPALTDEDESRLIENDDLADTISNVIEDDGRFGSSLISVDVSRGIARLSGEVETEEERKHLERLVLAVRGVRDIRSHVMLMGVDSQMPWDYDQ